MTKLLIKNASGQQLHLGDTLDDVKVGDTLSLDGTEYTCVKTDAVNVNRSNGVGPSKPTSAEFISSDEAKRIGESIDAAIKDRQYKGPKLTGIGSMLRHPPSKAPATKTVEVHENMELVPKAPEPKPTEIPANPVMPVSANPELQPSAGDAANAAADNVAAVASDDDSRGNRRRR